jgi:membrane protein
MAAPTRLNSQSSSLARKAPPSPPKPISGDLIVIAALIGISRAIFRPQQVQRGRQRLRNLPEGGASGRQADTPAEITAKGWKDISRRVYVGVQNDRILLVAAGVTFYGLLALFPATAALVSLYGLFADATTIDEQFRLLQGFLPEGGLDVIGEQVRRITAQGQSTLGLTFLGTLGLALWGANAGTKSIFDVLNIIYKEEEKRGFVKLTLWSLAFTVGAIAVALLALAAVVVLPVALQLIGVSEQRGANLFNLLRWPLLYLLLLFALACLYSYGASRRHPQWRWVSWGSAIAGAIWLAGSLLFSWYVANFGSYNATYGSLGAVIGFMVWLWLSTIVVLLGAEINAAIEDQTARDTTQGPNKRTGARGASTADAIGEPAPKL